MKNIFSGRVDFTPLRVMFSIIAISLVGIFSDVSAMTGEASSVRPTILNVKGELKTCPVPYVDSSCERKSKQVNFCQDGSGNILKTLDPAPLFDKGIKPFCSFSSQSMELRNES